MAVFGNFSFGMGAGRVPSAAAGRPTSVWWGMTGGFARGAFRFGPLQQFGLGGGAALRFLGSAGGGFLGGGFGGLALGA